MTRPWFMGTTKGGERETCRIVSTGEPLTEYLTLARSPGRFVVRHERLAPGRRASSAHSHSKIEEFIVVLAGRLQVWIDGETHGLGPGDYVVFTAATGVAHFLFNDSDTLAEYLTVASVEGDDVVTYRR